MTRISITTLASTKQDAGSRSDSEKAQLPTPVSTKKMPLSTAKVRRAKSLQSFAGPSILTSVGRSSFACNQLLPVSNCDSHTPHLLYPRPPRLYVPHVHLVQDVTHMVNAVRKRLNQSHQFQYVPRLSLWKRALRWTRWFRWGCIMLSCNESHRHHIHTNSNCHIPKCTKHAA